MSKKIKDHYDITDIDLDILAGRVDIEDDPDGYWHRSQKFVLRMMDRQHGSMTEAQVAWMENILEVIQS